MTTTTLIPGLLVSLKTSVTGNVRYFRRELEGARSIEGSQSTQEKFETTKTVADPANHEAAGKARTAARGVVSKLCISSGAFGLLCPADREAELDAAIVEARKIADEFNESSTVSTLRVYILKGRIASNDEEAIRAINSEVQELIEQMADGVQTKDVKAIREAAGRAKALGNMLSIDAASKVQLAIDTARQWAKEANKATKNGKDVGADQATVNRVRSAAALFMDDVPAEAAAAPRGPAQSALDLGV